MEMVFSLYKSLPFKVLAFGGILLGAFSLLENLVSYNGISFPRIVFDVLWVGSCALYLSDLRRRHGRHRTYSHKYIVCAIWLALALLATYRIVDSLDNMM